MTGNDSCFVEPYFTSFCSKKITTGEKNNFQRKIKINQNKKTHEPESSKKSSVYKKKWKQEKNLASFFLQINYI